jgi:hypothetical protein
MMNLTVEQTLVVVRQGRFWVAAEQSEDVARSIGWRPSGRFEAHGTPPVDGFTLGRILLRALRMGYAVRMAPED